MHKTIIIGAGEVGRYFAQQMLKSNPKANIVLIGDEKAYNRIALVHLLDGSHTHEQIVEEAPCPVVQGTVERINSDARTVLMTDGRIFTYDSLVLATGAQPITLPDCPEGVYPIRTLAHANHILARIPSAQDVVVVGAGVLGVEAACAIKDGNPAARVVLLNSSGAVLERMLDGESGKHMAALLTENGISVQCNVSVKTLHADTSGEVSGVELNNGTMLPANLVILAIGVRPHDSLAVDAGLECNRGVITDSEGRTSAPNIYAIGDCTKASRGLLADGYSQADVVASVISGKEQSASAKSAVAVNRLKTHHKAYSVGVLSGAKEIKFRSPHIFRKLFLDADNHLVGAVVFGAWDELHNVEHAVMNGETLSRAKQASFKHFGKTSFVAPSPLHWNDATIVCQCKGITKGDICRAKTTCQTVEEIGMLTGAGTGCGGCKPVIAALLNQKPKAVKYAKPLTVFTIVAAVLGLLLLAFSIPYPDSFHSVFGPLYREKLSKQITGYGILAFVVALSVVSIRKRKFKGPYDTWKVIHTALGALVLGGLVVHSGGRFGSGLTFGLSISFLGTAISGALLGWVYSKSHQMNIGKNKLASKAFHWLHILFLWPLPVLLAFHVLQSYLWS